MFSRRNIFFIIFILVSFSINSSAITKTIYASWEKPDVELFYKLPKQINKDTKVLFIIHGASRDVNRYLESWIESAKDKNVILIAPFFSEESFPFFSTLELATSSGKILKNSSKSLTNSISSFYTFFKSKYNLRSDTYLIYGFSGGSQFVHRYMMFGEDTRIEKAAIGSAGWHTFLNDEPFPFGTKNMELNNARKEWFLSREVLFILGKNDDDPNHSSLNSNKEAKKQGMHRYERGQNYFNNLINYSDNSKLPFRWRYMSVEGLDHNVEGMTDAAIPFLLSDLDYKD